MTSPIRYPYNNHMTANVITQSIINGTPLGVFAVASFNKNDTGNDENFVEAKEREVENVGAEYALSDITKHYTENQGNVVAVDMDDSTDEYEANYLMPPELLLSLNKDDMAYIQVFFKNFFKTLRIKNQDDFNEWKTEFLAKYNASRINEIIMLCDASFLVVEPEMGDETLEQVAQSAEQDGQDGYPENNWDDNTETHELITFRYSTFGRVVVHPLINEAIAEGALNAHLQLTILNRDAKGEILVHLPIHLEKLAELI